MNYPNGIPITLYLLARHIFHKLGDLARTLARLRTVAVALKKT